MEIKQETIKKLCKNCKYYDYSNHSDWAHTIIFHTCRHKDVKYTSNCLTELNANDDCKLFEEGEPINSPYSKKEIKKQEDVMKRRNNANIFMATGKFIDHDKLDKKKKKGIINRIFDFLTGWI